MLVERHKRCVRAEGTKWLPIVFSEITGPRALGATVNPSQPESTGGWKRVSDSGANVDVEIPRILKYSLEATWCFVHAL